MRDLDPLSCFICYKRDRLRDPKVQPSQTIHFPRELDALLVEVRTEATMGYLQ